MNDVHFIYRGPLCRTEVLKVCSLDQQHQCIWALDENAELLVLLQTHWVRNAESIAQ